MWFSKWCIFSLNLFGVLLVLSIFEYIIGDRVNVIILDIKIELVSVSVNFLNSELVILFIKVIGV